MRNVVFSAQLIDADERGDALDLEGARKWVLKWLSGETNVTWAVEDTQWAHLPRVRGELRRRFGVRLHESWTIDLDRLCKLRWTTVGGLGVPETARARFEGSEIVVSRRCEGCGVFVHRFADVLDGVLVLPRPRQEMAVFGNLAATAIAEPLLDELRERGLATGLVVRPVRARGSDHSWFLLADGPTLGPVACPFGAIETCETCLRRIPRFGFFPIYQRPTPEPDWCWSSPRQSLAPMVTRRVFEYFQQRGASLGLERPVQMGPGGWVDTDHALAFLPERFQGEE